VGTQRLPDWDDEASLSYIKACVDESLRWRTVTILGGIPHAPSQDDVYNDYFIPKGTWITGNMWAINRNPDDFPEPDVFRPERFLERERPYPNKKGHHAFGWGKRQCSGQPLAEQGLFLTFARLLWAFEIRPGLDANVSDNLYPPHLWYRSKPSDRSLHIYRARRFRWTSSHTESPRICVQSLSEFVSLLEAIFIGRLS
jgi:hypothetical protein